MNKEGWLVDGEGNIVDRKGRKKLDKTQLDPEEDLQQLYTYKGSRFDI